MPPPPTPQVWRRWIGWSVSVGAVLGLSIAVPFIGMCIMAWVVLHLMWSAGGAH